MVSKVTMVIPNDKWITVIFNLLCILNENFVGSSLFSQQSVENKYREQNF